MTYENETFKTFTANNAKKQFISKAIEDKVAANFSLLREISNSKYPQEFAFIKMVKEIKFNDISAPLY
jgi:hypothetical protein